MKIAMIGLKQMFGCEGGIEKTVRHLSFGMAEKGHSVTVYERGGAGGAGPSGTGDVPEALREKIKIVRIPTIPGAAGVPLYSFLAAVRAALSDCDLVMFHASGPCLMLPVAKLGGKKTVAFLHGRDSLRSKWGRFASWYLGQGEKAAATQSDALLVLTEEDGTWARETYGKEAFRVFNGAEAPEEDPETPLPDGLVKDGYFIWSGRISREKGLQYLIPAYRRTRTDKLLLLAGRVSGRNRFFRMLKKAAGEDPRIRFIGYRTGRELAALYRNAFAFVLPSEMEGMAHSLLEALACGAPCILSDIPENRAVAGGHALYFPSGDTGALAGRMREWLDRPEARFGPAEGESREILRRFSVKESVDRITGICEAVLAESRKAGRAGRC